MVLFTLEQLNFFKLSSIVIDEFPVTLRKVFVYMWDTLVAPKHGCQKWDNSTAVLNFFLSREGGVAKVPTLNKSYELWDCTGLFRATLFAETFALPDASGNLATLNTMYVKPHGLSSGSFHTTVISPTGNQAETFALALDQLRRLRNSLCHQYSTKKIDKATFDHYVLLAKDAFVALAQDIGKIDDIGKLGEDDFPTARVHQLEEELKKEKDAAINHLDKMEWQVKEIASDMEDVKSGVTDVTAKVEEISSNVKDVKANIEELKEAKQAENSKGPLVPASCIPDKIPHFIGRQEECHTVLDHLLKGDTRVVDIFGPPGFGKTSVAINVAHHLREMKNLVYFISLREMKSKEELVSRLLSIFADATQVPHHISPSHWLIRCLQQLQNPFVLILDNADDVLESEDTKMKEEVLKYMEEILAQCSHSKLLFTTRQSLDYLNHKLSIHVEKVGVLDESSSSSLVKSLLPDVSADACSSILKACGQVPLAMRLMCSLIRGENMSVDELMLELKNSPLVKVLDNEHFSDDVRLNNIINTSFERLRSNERDAFISLAVFPGWFGIEDATEVLHFKHTRPTKMIRSLEQKSLIDCSDNSFTIHSLLRSFIDEKRRTDKEIGAVFHSAQCNFYNHHISRFYVANEAFLTGHSTDAVHAFFGQRENILLALENGIKVNELYSKAVDALSKAELFLYATLPGEEFLFSKLYNTAVDEAKRRGNLADERKLLAAKSFSHWGWFSHSCQAWDHSQYPDCTNADCPAKLLCYYGIHQLLCGMIEKGISSVEDSYIYLGQFSDERVLKKLAEDVLIKFLLKGNGLDEDVSEGNQRHALTTQIMGHCLRRHMDKVEEGYRYMRNENPGWAHGLFSLFRSMAHSVFCHLSGTNEPTMKLPNVQPTVSKPPKAKKDQTPESDGNRANIVDDVIFRCVRMKLLHYFYKEKRFPNLDRGTTALAKRGLSSRQEISSFLKEYSKVLKMMSSMIEDLEQKPCLGMDRKTSVSLSHLARIIEQLSPDSWHPLLICDETLLQIDSFLQGMRTYRLIDNDACTALEEQLYLLRCQLQVFWE